MDESTWIFSEVVLETVVVVKLAQQNNFNCEFFSVYSVFLFLFYFQDCILNWN